MRRRGFLVVATALCLFGTSLVWASPASAAGGITVTPNSDLTPADFVRVDGAGYPNPDTYIPICETLLDGLERLDLDCLRPHGSSSQGQSVPFRHPSASGTFSVSILVYRFVDSTRLGRTIDCAVERCAVGAIAETVAYAPITFAPGLADGRVKRRSDGVIFGDDAYHSGPPLFEIGNVGSQHRSHAIEPGGYWTYAVQVQNDGLVTEDLIVTASTFTSSPGLPGDAQFFYGYFDLTSSVLGGSGLTFPDMAPGEVRTFAVRFHVPTDMPEGSFVQATVRFASRSAAITDEVNVNAMVPAAS